MKKRSIFSACLLLAALGSGCSSAYYASAGMAGDDLYATHDKVEIARKQQAEAEARKAAAEARRAEWEARLAEAKAEAAENSYYDQQQENEEDLSYSSVLADTYESAYARRLRGFESMTYRMPSSYYNFRYGSAFNYVSAYDPAFYNIVFAGDEVWVEPKYITSMFGSWGVSVYSGWNWGWNWNWNWGWNYPSSWWGYPYGGWSWGFAYHPWHDPWHHPGWGWGPGWHGGWHVHGGYRRPHNYRLDSYTHRPANNPNSGWRSGNLNNGRNNGRGGSYNRGRSGSYNNGRGGSYNNRGTSGNSSYNNRGTTRRESDSNRGSYNRYNSYNRSSDSQSSGRSGNYNNNSGRSNYSGGSSSGGFRSSGGSGGGSSRGGGSYNSGR